MVRDYRSRNSTQKRNNTSVSRNNTTGAAKVRPASSVNKVNKVAHSTAKRPAQKKKAGFFANLLYSKRKPGEPDYTFLLLVGVLVAFGLIMLLSASTPTASTRFGNSYHFFLRQLIFVILGGGLMFGLSSIDYRNIFAIIFS